ncbi:nucleoside phosphorylase domain-containing protein [Aspergillus carlsbadensis]|nr:nucleoside phosphorylase domain-containing protein [Aspergillus carlsbadensis]
MASSKQLSLEDYRVACITIIAEEFAAFEQMFDARHTPPIGIDERDPNNYEFGEVAGHNVVLCAAAQAGTGWAATTATNFWRTFKGINLGLLVGIGAGVPSSNRDIRLGDVVVAAPGQLSNGITHYDHGKQLSDAFILLNIPDSIPKKLQGAVRRMQAVDILRQSTMPRIISSVIKDHAVFERPDTRHDLLFQATYEHINANPNCDECSKEHLVSRIPRECPAPRVHYGPIASGNQVVKSAEKRETLRELYGVYCIEMEAAGVMPALPSLVIKGISDYADSHKNDRWKKYAALAAAAYAKELLTRIPPPDTSSSSIVRSSGITTSGQTTAALCRDQALEELLERTARQIHAGDWRKSVVDLMKVLGLSSDRTSRDHLATILRVNDGSSGSWERNNALRRALMGRLAVEGGAVVFPSELEALRY